MKLLRFGAVLALAVCLFTPALHATSYVVPTDRHMIEAAPAIVSGTVIDKYCRRAADGSIETVTEVRIEERLKGGGDERTMKIVQWGGHLDHQWMVQSDAPEFTRGERVLLFATRNDDGEWTTWSLGLGAFRFHRDPLDVAILERFSIVGWTEDGEPHVERPRLEKDFLTYIRSVVRGEKPEPKYYAPDEAAPMTAIHGRVQVNDTFTSSSYSSAFADVFARRLDTMLNVQWRPIGTPTGLDLLGAVDFGDTQWDNQSPKITYSRGATASGDTKDLNDAEERVIANDPHGDIAGTFPGTTSVVATAFSQCSGIQCDYFTFNGESFLPFTSSDIVVNDGVSSTSVSASVFNVAVAHEIGHTLGLRHSNQLQTNSGACAAPLECCINTPSGGNCKAVMQSSVVSLANLQQWDKNAIDCLYDAVCNGGVVSYNPPTSVVAAATSATSVDIVWSAPSGTTPDQYDIYRSANGTTFTQINTVPHPTTNYTDPTAAADTAYLYKVRAASTGGTNESADSNKDFATTMDYTDPTITAQTTVVKAAHITQLRTAVNALRTLNGGQSAFSFTDSTLDSTVAIKAAHVTELQTQLNAVRTALGFSTITFTETPAADASIKKLHVDELRAGVE